MCWQGSYLRSINTTTWLLALHTSWSTGLLAVWISLHKGDIKREEITRKENCIFLVIANDKTLVWISKKALILLIFLIIRLFWNIHTQLSKSNRIWTNSEEVCKPKHCKKNNPMNTVGGGPGVWAMVNKYGFII